MAYDRRMQAAFRTLLIVIEAKKIVVMVSHSPTNHDSTPAIFSTRLSLIVTLYKWVWHSTSTAGFQ